LRCGRKKKVNLQSWNGSSIEGICACEGFREIRNAITVGVAIGWECPCPVNHFPNVTHAVGIAVHASGAAGKCGKQNQENKKDARFHSFMMTLVEESRLRTSGRQIVF